MRFAGFAKSPQIGRCDIFGRLLYNLQLIVSYLYLGGFEGNWLITCRFSAFFLVVSIKKRTFAEKFNV